MALSLSEWVDRELGHHPVDVGSRVGVVGGAHRRETDHAVPAGITGIQRHQHPQRRQGGTGDRVVPGRCHRLEVDVGQSALGNRRGQQLRPTTTLDGRYRGSL